MDDDQVDDRQLSPMGTYSYAADLARKVLQAKGSPQQYKAALTKQGVKPDEFKYSNYDQAFADKPMVTRDQLAQHFQQSLPPVQETTLGARQGTIQHFPDTGYHIQWPDGIMSGGYRTEAAANAAMQKRNAEGGNTKFSQYTLPGGTNYRETLLHLPENEPSHFGDFEEYFKKNYRYHPGTHVYELGRQDAMRNWQAAQGQIENHGDNSNYMSSHWDTPNVLAHLRMSDRALPGGQKALHLEELQSDWAQEGRKKGFKDLNADEFTQNTEGYHKIPSAPYVDSTQKWVDLGLKRLLHEAAKGGYHKIVMTPGEEQAKRYDLSKQVKELKYFPKEQELHVLPHDTHKHEILSMPPEKLEQHVGKDVAKKLLEQPLGHTKYAGHDISYYTSGHHLEGEGLRVGGEGMKAFYDQMLPKALEKLAKKHDPEAKIGMTQNIPGLRARGTKLHSLDITPRMRASILKGQTAYATGGSVPDPSVAMPPTDVGMGHNGGPLFEPDGAPVTPSHGGLSFPEAEGAERLRMRAKRAASGKPVGEPGNPRTVIKAPIAEKGQKQLPDFVTGNINFEDWRKRHEQILEPHEIHEAGKWYGKIDDMFRRYYPDDPALAKKHRNAWLVAQQNISPPGAMNNVLMQQEQMNRGVPKELWTAGGMPNPTAAARSVLQDQPIEGGVGQKISDFVDSAEGKPVRSWMNNHPHGGSPFVVDVHTARDTGMVDEELLNHLKRLNYAVPEGLKKDLGTSPGAPQYENRAEWGRRLTDHLNKMKWQGRSNWTPAEIQAVGWMGMTKLTRNKEEGAEEGLDRNLRRISTELSPGEGSPWHKKYGAAFDALPEEHKYGLTRKMTNSAMKHAQNLAGINLQSMVHGTGGWEGKQNPSAIGQALATKQGADIAAHALGYLLNQTEVWHNRVKPPTKNPGGFGIDMIEHGDTNHLHDPKNLQDLWAKVQKADKTGLIKGYQPIVTPSGGKKGIRVLIDKGGAGTLSKLDASLKKGGELDALLSSLPYDVRSELHEAEITKARNDWKEHPNGQAYIRGLEQTLGRNPAADLDVARSQLEKELEAHLDEAHAKAGTSWRTQKAGGGSVGSEPLHAGAGSGVGRIEKMRRQSGDLGPNKTIPADDALIEKALALAQSGRKGHKNGGAVTEEASVVAEIKSDLNKLTTVLTAQNAQIDKLTRLLSAPQIVERDENNRIKKIYRDAH